MAGPTSLPCPMCGRMNALDKLSCTTCGYEFVSREEAERHASIFKRAVDRLTGRV